MIAPTVTAPRLAVRNGVGAQGWREVPEEAAVALVYGGTTHAVLMATPQDLEDLAIGFTLTERIAARADEIEALSVEPHAEGVELRMWLSNPLQRAYGERRRRIVGPTGCGLCGVESLAEAAAPPARVAPGVLRERDIAEAVAALRGRQVLGDATHAVHAAALWAPSEGLVAVREDVGRHNALDKLAGALARDGRDASGGVVVLTSRVSVEMVQKAAAIGAAAIAAVSAPTALAIRTAETAGLILAAVARDDGFEVFTGAERLTG